MYISGRPTMIGLPQQQTQLEGVGRERISVQASRQTNRQKDRHTDNIMIYWVWER